VPAPAPDPDPEEEIEEPVDFSVPTVVPATPDAGTTEIEVHEIVMPAPRPRPLKPDPRVQGLDGIVVGRELAKNLRLYEGMEVDVISPLGKVTPAGEVPRTRSFRVAGVFFTGMYEYDARIVYVSIPALQSFLGLGDEVTGIEIKVSDMDETDRLLAAVRGKLGPEYRVKDWKELNRGLFSALKIEQIGMFIVLVIIIIVAAFSIVSNLIMVVVEKAREIAILKSMGSSDGSVMRVFIAEGLYIGILGTLFGLVVGLAACWALDYFGLPLDSEVYYIDRLPVAVQPLNIVLIAFAGVAISIVATLYPAWIGARLNPVDGLRQ
jgi:lipoprotein-releasing system permease protein